MSRVNLLALETNFDYTSDKRFQFKTVLSSLIDLPIWMLTYSMSDTYRPIVLDARGELTPLP